MMILKRIFSSSWMLVIKDAKPLVLASRDTFIASTSRSSALLTLFNATQFRVPKGDVMPAEIRAQVDVAKEIPGGTLKFTTRKKRLEDKCERNFLLSLLLKVTFMPSDSGDKSGEECWRSLCYDLSLLKSSVQ